MKPEEIVEARKVVRQVYIDEKIERAQEDVIKAKKKYDETVEALEKLMTKKKEMQQKELLQAFANSSKSYDEILKFLSE